MNFKILLLIVIFWGCCCQEIGKEITFNLLPGTSEEFEIPLTISGYQKAELSLFHNEKSFEITFPCNVKTKARPYYNRYSQQSHQLASSSQLQFWQNGIVWDLKLINNRIICVFQQGQVTEYTISQSKKLSKLSKYQPFSGKSISYGKLIAYTDNNTEYLLYISQNNSYLIKDQLWLPFTGFQQIAFSQVKCINNKIYLSNKNTIIVYSLNISTLQMNRQQKYSLYFSESQKTFPLNVKTFEYDQPQKVFYAIDSSQGVKYFRLGNSSNVTVKHLVPSQNCEQIIIQYGYLFISCSRLIVIHTQTHEIRAEKDFRFYPKKLILHDSYVITLGDRQFAIYSISNNSNDINIRFLQKGLLPKQRYQKFIYHSKSKGLLLINKNNIVFGEIIQGRYDLQCSYSKLLSYASAIDKAIYGMNRANLTVYGLCNQEGKISSQCNTVFPINVNLYNTTIYKDSLFLVGTLITLLFVIFCIFKLIKLKRKSSAAKEKYQQLTEETIISTENISQPDEKVISAFLSIEK